jgi:hypothetical protein
MTSGSGKNDKYAFLYDFAKGSFDGELQRYRNIEEKASRYMAFLSILIVSYTTILRFSVDLFFPVDGFFKGLAVVLVCISYVSLCSAWSLLFRAVRFVEMPRLPCDDETIEDFDKHGLATMHLSLAKTCIEGGGIAREANSRKVRLLMKAHDDIGVCTWAITLSVGTLVVLKIIA